DLLHPEISGNKYRKLKYNLEKAKSDNHDTILTFGGAYSNHVAAVAAAGKVEGFKTIGIIRGEELSSKIEENPTLKYAQENGMELRFVSREVYKQKSSKKFLAKIKQEFGEVYILPEGGTNKLAIVGCEEILDNSLTNFNYICCPVGTGGTVAGIINCSKPRQQVLGFSALKGDFLKSEIGNFVNKDNWKLITDYHFGGYAKMSEGLIQFINEFNKKFSIQLDPIYTGKMFYGIFDLAEKGYFEDGSQILAIHTGGLQGIHGANQKLKNKKMPLIEL
ncbi:MAG: pyridoxal-phosphate dependent enzyme, partial [Flavobacteriaceae bacterium]|nr:pyridoxal-phosphate dependent enzyme [Flavobacteriaceae bacterium]